MRDFIRTHLLKKAGINSEILVYLMFCVQDNFDNSEILTLEFVAVMEGVHLVRQICIMFLQTI